jgi:hypothetical protein
MGDQAVELWRPPERVVAGLAECKVVQAAPAIFNSLKDKFSIISRLLWDGCWLAELVGWPWCALHMRFRLPAWGSTYFTRGPHFSIFSLLHTFFGIFFTELASMILIMPKP